MTEPEIDVQQSHRYFSAHCFNAAWDLLGKEDRTAEDDEQMLLLSLTSTWHWIQRADCSDKNISVGNWQTSRIYSVLGQIELARKYAHLCLTRTPANEPFYLGYAHEAIARAEKLAGNNAVAAEHVELAKNSAAKVDDPQSREMLEKDLAELS